MMGVYLNNHDAIVQNRVVMDDQGLSSVVVWL